MVHDGLSPFLVLLKAGLDAGQAECVGTGEHSHTLGSQSPHRSLKYREDRTGESVYFQVGAVLIVWLDLHLLNSSADLDEILFANIFVDSFVSTRWLGNFTRLENEFSM